MPKVYSDWVREHPLRPNVLPIEVEGAAGDVLRGMGSLLAEAAVRGLPLP